MCVCNVCEGTCASKLCNTDKEGVLDVCVFEKAWLCVTPLGAAFCAPSDKTDVCVDCVVFVSCVVFVCVFVSICVLSRA